MKLISKLLILGAVALAGSEVYRLNRIGYFSMPDLPKGAYFVAFPSGFRGIVTGIPVEDYAFADGPAYFRDIGIAKPDRHFIGYPLDVPKWLQKSWSRCAPPTDEEQEYVFTNMPEESKQSVLGARLDSICYIDLDAGQRMPRGLIFSFPKV